MQAIQTKILDAKQSGKTLFAVLLDPDKPVDQYFINRIRDAEYAGVDLFLVGGSLMSNDFMEDTIKAIRQVTNIPVLLFPGSSMQVTPNADALLFLSLISGRNPDLLIGHHVMAAPYVKKSGLEVIPTGYMLVDGGSSTTAHYVSQSLPIPHDKPHIASTTAMAGEMLGLKVIYLDAGSGARIPVSQDMIKAVRAAVDLPIIVGGGMSTQEDLQRASAAGADVVVVGNALERGETHVASLSAALNRTL
jgi:putative glycerol-1-phosphate prenyltransferase